MKEIEVKILEINPQKIREALKKKKAKLVMLKNKQENLFYANPEIEKFGIIRLRKNIFGSTIAFKSKLRFSKGYKVMNEYETEIKDFTKVRKGLELIGLKQIGCIEAIREDWRLYGCLISIVKLPKIPIYLEIEGKKKDILKISKLFSYTEKDYYPKLIYDKYNIKTKFLKFSK